MSDNLESYFRKHLKEETPGPEQWNVPSDSVWDKVQPGISKRKGIFIPWRYFYIFGIGLVLMISTLVLWPENKEDLLVNKNDARTKSGLTEQIKTTGNVSGVSNEKELNNSLDNNSGIESSSSTTSSKNINTDATLIQRTAENKTDSKTSNDSQQAGSSTNESVSTAPLIVIEQENQNYSDASVIIVTDDGSGNNTENLPGTLSTDDNYSTNANVDETNSRVEAENLESNVFVYSSSIDYFPINQGFANLKGYDYLNAQKAKPIPFSQGKFGVGAYYTATYTSTEVTGLELPANDQMGSVWLFSSNWGFDFYYYLSYRFTLVSGVGSSEIRSWSKTTSQFNYDPSTEHDMGNNQTANGTEQTSPTPFGALSSEVVYSFPSDANIPDGELMESVSETFQNIRYLSIPLGVEYNLLNQEKSLWFLETGINYNLSMRDQTELLPQILHEGEEMNIMDSKITQDPDYENNYWGFYIGTGYKYPVSKRIQLSGTVRYNRSISPLKSIGSTTTKVQGYQLKVGVVYLLH